jgi:hypothetical protein
MLAGLDAFVGRTASQSLALDIRDDPAGSADFNQLSLCWNAGGLCLPGPDGSNAHANPPCSYLELRLSVLHSPRTEGGTVEHIHSGHPFGRSCDATGGKIRLEDPGVHALDSGAYEELNEIGSFLRPKNSPRINR